MSQRGPQAGSSSQASPASTPLSHGAEGASGGTSTWASTIVSLPATQQGRIALTAVASCAVTAASIFSYQAAVRLARRRDLAKRVDKATHRDRDLEKKQLHQGSHHPLLGALGAEDDEESIDGGTPRYLDHLAHLTPARNQAAASGVNRSSSSLRRQNSRSSVPGIGVASSSSKLGPNTSTTYDETLIREQLARNFSFVGDEAMRKLRESFVVVVGLGGVGSHAALSLIRSGVGHIRLIDFDQVSLSSLNRHAVANLEDVGRPKVVVCQEHFRGIAPWVHIQAWVEIFNESEAGRLFSPFRVSGTSKQAGREVPPTYVIDCIDNLNTKVGLLAYCHEHDIKVFSSMGAGAKCDPTRICIGDLTFTEEDPLAKSVRRKLRERGIPKLPPQEKKQPPPPPKKKSKKLQQQQKEETEQHNGPTVGTPPRKTLADVRSTEVTPRPGPSAWKDKMKGTSGESQWSVPPGFRSRASSRSQRISRNSSVSSFGSGEGAFFTPEGTPREENDGWDAEFAEPLPELRLEDHSGESQQVDDALAASPKRTTQKALPRTTSRLGALQRPELGSHRSSSGLESLTSSPLAEKNETEASDAGYSIESTPGFAPSAEGDGEPAASALGPGQIWKRANSRRESLGPESEAHQVDRRQSDASTSSPGLSRMPSAMSKTSSTSAQANHSGVEEEEEEKGESEASRPRVSQTDEAEAKAEPTLAAASASPTAQPWTTQNPRYLIPCIFSTEKPSAQLLPLDEAELAKDGGAEMLRALEDGNDWRVRTLPVLGPLPAIFGLSIAAFVLCDMAGKENLMEPLQSKIRRKSAEKTLKELESLESNNPLPSSASSRSTAANRSAVKGREVPFLLDDVVYLIMEVFRNRSVVPPFVSVSQASLVRWDSTLPLSHQNVALMTKEQAKKHTQEVLKKGKSPVEVWGNEAAELWRKRMEEERWYARFR